MRVRAGIPEILMCTLTWGSIGPLRKQISLPSGAVAFFRLLLGMLVVAAWMALRGRLRDLRPRARPVLLVSFGVVIGLHWVLELEAFRRLDVAPAILIIFVGPVLWALAAPAVLGERASPAVLGALAVAFAGLALITLPDVSSLDGVGLAAATGSGVLFAALILVGKILVRDYTPEVLVVWQLAVGAVVVSPWLLGTQLDQVARALPLLGVLGVVYTGLLGLAYFRAVRALGAQQLGVLFYFEPASAVAYAWVLLDETPSPATLAGGALIVAAGLAIILGERTAAAPAGFPEPAPEGRP